MHRGECFTTGGLYRPTHLCVAHLDCTKKKVYILFFGVLRLGDVWRGGGGGGSMFQEVGDCMGFQGRVGWFDYIMTFSNKVPFSNRFIKIVFQNQKDYPSIIQYKPQCEAPLLFYLNCSLKRWEQAGKSHLSLVSQCWLHRRNHLRRNLI